jgi:hypothetical protein
LQTEAAPLYDILADEGVTHGTLAFDKSQTWAGDQVVVTKLEPEANYRLAEGSLTYNGTAVPYTGSYYSFIMPSRAVTVTAVFEPIPPETYAVTVLGGGDGGGGPYEAKETVTISASGPDYGYRFDHWASEDPEVDFEDAGSAETRFTMPPRNVTVEAVFVEADFYEVTVESAGPGATGGGQHPEGAPVSIFAGEAPEYQQFEQWASEDPDVDFGDAYATQTSFTMPSRDVTVTAVFGYIPGIQFNVAVSGGTLDGGAGSGSYGIGDTVGISAGTAPTGQRFARWTSGDGVTFADPTAAETTFEMPPKDVAVTAVFEKIPATPAEPPISRYTVTVDGGSGSGSYVAGATVSISAGAAPEGQQFARWSGSGIAFADANAADTSFTMPARDVTVTAVYEDLEEPPVTEPPVTEPPVEEPPVIGPDPAAPSTVILELALPDENGKISAVLEDAAVEAAIEQVKAALAETGAEGQPLSLLIIPEGSGEAGAETPKVQGLEVVLQPGLIALLEANGVQELGISVPGQFQFVLNEAAIAELGVQSAGAGFTGVTLEVTAVDVGEIPAAEDVKDALEAALGSRSNRPLLDFSIWAENGEQGERIPITNLSGGPGAGQLTRTIAYQMQYYENPEYLYVVRVDADGTPSRVPGAWYDEVGDRMVWTGDTCSYYGVGYGKPEDAEPEAAPAAPEKVQLIYADAVRQYDYYTVLPGGVNRAAFVADILALSEGDEVLLLAGGFWYDVNGITLREAAAQNRLDDPSPSYLAILENGAEAVNTVSEIIDRVNRLYPLTPAKLAKVYARYEALTPEEQALIAHDQAVRDMLETVVSK